MVTTLLYFAPVRWDDYPQRPHSFVHYFLQRGGRQVIWVDPCPARFPTLADLGRTRRAPLTGRSSAVQVIGPLSLPFEPLAACRSLNRALFHRRLLARLSGALAPGSYGIGIGRPSDLALLALESLKPAWSMYDAMDDFPEFYRGWSRGSVTAIERAIAGRVDAIVTPSTALWDKFEAYGPRRALIRNAFDMTALPPPGGAVNGRPIFGYVGCVSAWFDWPAVVAIAEGRPDAKVEIVGPRFGEPASLPANVSLFPACSHEDTVAHLQRFTVGLIPFKRNRLTDGVDPIKYYAYRAMGLPVLTTKFGEMADLSGREGTFHLDGPASLPAVAATALACKLDTEAVARFRQAHDWARRFEDAGLFDRVLGS